MNTRQAWTSAYFTSTARILRSSTILPTRKIRRLLLGTLVLSTICLFSFSMVTQIQDIGTQDDIYKRDIVLRSNDDKNVNQRSAFPRQHRNLVARETLAVADDYQDLAANNNNNKKSEEKVNFLGPQTFQNVFLKNQTKNGQDESQWRRDESSNAERRIKNGAESLSHDRQPFHKTKDADGRVLFEIQNGQQNNRDKSDRKSVRFFKQAENERGRNVGGEKLDDMREEETDYSYNYDDSKEQPPNINNDLPQQIYNNKPVQNQFKFLQENKEKGAMPLRGLFGNNNDALVGGGDNNKMKNSEDRGRDSNKMEETLPGNKEMHLAAAHVGPSQRENWPNSHQMRDLQEGEKEEDSPKAGQFVDGMLAPGEEKAVNRAVANGASRIQNQGGNLLLLQGMMGNDLRGRVDRTQPETGGDANEMKGPRGQEMGHKDLSPDKVAALRDTNTQSVVNHSLPILALKSQKNDRPVLNPKHELLSPPLEYLNDHAKIETQIPIQEGPPPVPVEYPATQLQYPQSLRRNVTLVSKEGMPLIVDKVYWSNEALDLVPPGISEKEFQQFLKAAASEKVVVMEKAAWNKCGRPKNQYLLLESGMHMCARYRENFKMVQGEILSFYLSRFLGLDNIPPVALAKVDTNASQWQDVTLQISEAGWEENHIINQIMWIDSIGKQSNTKMPFLVLKAFESNETLTWRNPMLRSLSPYSISELIQWSDLVLYDYITANYDRVASMQDGAEHEKRPDVMHENMRNLPKDRTGKLWLIDNESGLLDAYNLVISPVQKFHTYHRKMLQTFCIFNEKTVGKILTLAKFPEPHQLLVNYAKEQDSLFRLFPEEHKEFSLFKHMFHTRLKDISTWIEQCRNL